MNRVSYVSRFMHFPKVLKRFLTSRRFTKQGNLHAPETNSVYIHLAKRIEASAIFLIQLSIFCSILSCIRIFLIICSAPNKRLHVSRDKATLEIKGDKRFILRAIEVW